MVPLSGFTQQFHSPVPVSGSTLWFKSLVQLSGSTLWFNGVVPWRGSTLCYVCTRSNPDNTIITFKYQKYLRVILYWNRLPWVRFIVKRTSGFPRRRWWWHRSRSDVLRRLVQPCSRSSSSSLHRTLAARLDSWRLHEGGQRIRPRSSGSRRFHVFSSPFGRSSTPSDVESGRKRTSAVAKSLYDHPSSWGNHSPTSKSASRRSRRRYCGRLLRWTDGGWDLGRAQEGSESMDGTE